MIWHLLCDVFLMGMLVSFICIILESLKSYILMTLSAPNILLFFLDVYH